MRSLTLLANRTNVRSARVVAGPWPWSLCRAARSLAARPDEPDVEQRPARGGKAHDEDEAGRDERLAHEAGALARAPGIAGRRLAGSRAGRRVRASRRNGLRNAEGGQQDER